MALKDKEYSKQYRLTHKAYFARKAKEYRERNREAVLERRRKHYKEHSAEILEKRRNNPKLIAYSRKYHKDHKAKENEYSRTYRRTHLKENAEGSRKYRALHPERYKKSLRESHQRHKVERNKQKSQKNKERRLMVIDHYSDGLRECKICHETILNFLTIDHIRGRKNEGHSTLIGSDRLVNFLISKKFPPGYQILCWNHNRMKWIREPKEYSKNIRSIRARKKSNSLTHEILSYYSNNKLECNCCKFSEYDALSLDHIRGKKMVGHKRDMKGSKLYRYLKKLGFPPGYQVLCYNCNSGKSDSGICPHQRK